MHSFTKLEYHFGNGRTGIGKGLSLPWEKGHEWSLELSENSHNPGEILAPLYTFPSGRQLPARGTHVFLEAGPLQIKPVVKLVYVDILVV